MKLSNIIKNRKAMTPIMIGIIVAASVLAIFFVVMAATIPLYGREIEMTIRDNSIKANLTDNVHLIFRLICDYDDGVLTKAEIYKNTTMYGDLTRIALNEDVNIAFSKSQEQLLSLNFTIDPLYTPLPPEGTTPGGYLIFARYFEYNLRIYFEDTTGEVTAHKDFSFVYDD